MLEIIRKRRSVRSFLSNPIEKEKLQEILKAAMFSPTARGLRPWEFILVTENGMKEKLSRATPYASFAKNASLIIVICYDTGEGNRLKEDCSIAAENIYLESTNQGIGTYYIQISDGAAGSEGNPEDFVKKLLLIPEKIRVKCLMPLGYPSKEPEPHTDSEFDEKKFIMRHSE